MDDVITATLLLVISFAIVIGFALDIDRRHRIDNLEQQVEKISSDLDEMNESLQKIDENLSRIDRQLHDLETRVENIHGTNQHPVYDAASPDDITLIRDGNQLFIYVEKGYFNLYRVGFNYRYGYNATSPSCDTWDVFSTVTFPEAENLEEGTGEPYLGPSEAETIDLHHPVDTSCLSSVRVTLYDYGLYVVDDRVEGGVRNEDGEDIGVPDITKTVYASPVDGNRGVLP